MIDFQFLQNPLTKKWLIMAPKRAKRPDAVKGVEPVCPFCVGREKDEEEYFRIGGETGDENWQVRVIPNKFPFAPIHELVIHSPDHKKNFIEFKNEHVKKIIDTYKNRYNAHKKSGQVYIFHNRGLHAGESLPHAHTQITVIPFEITLDIPQLSSSFYAQGKIDAEGNSKSHSVYDNDDEMVKTNHFSVFCPPASEWPDEVWIAPFRRGRVFGDITDREASDLSFVIKRLIQILTMRHRNDFCFNYYIYPGKDFYIRIIPRLKTLGGFEIGTKVFINTQDPRETFLFLKEHFHTPDEEKIKEEHEAKYHTHV